MTLSSGILESRVISSSVMPSEKYSFSPSALMLTNGSTAIRCLSKEVDLRPWLRAPAAPAAFHTHQVPPRAEQHDQCRRQSRPAPFRRAGVLEADDLGDRAGIGQHAIRDHRLRNVLDPVLAHRLEAKGDLVLDLVVDIARDADAAGLGQLLQSRGNVHAVAIDVVVLDDDVADVDADPEHDAPVVGLIGLALGDARPGSRGAFDRVDHASELDQRTIAGELDDAAVMLGDLRLDEVLAQRFQACVRALLVGRHEPAIADDVRSQDRGQPALHRSRPIRNRRWMIGTSDRQNQRQAPEAAVA